MAGVNKPVKTGANMSEKDKDAKEVKDGKEKEKERPPVVVKAYRYATEIRQMCFVFGEKNATDAVVQCIEDIVRTHIGEIILQARTQAFIRRGARQLSAEDLLFLIRHDTDKVNRLRTYLSWRDVRRRLKEAQTEDADDGGMDLTEELSNEKLLKLQKMKIPLVWEISELFTEHLDGDSDGEVEDELDTHEDTKRQLKEADDLTASMTEKEYTYYSECRAASFTYKKGRRFRDFANLSSYIEGNPTDDVVDVLGFLAYEMVRSLCNAGHGIKDKIAYAREREAAAAEKKRRLSGTEEDGGAAMEIGDDSPLTQAGGSSPSKSRPALTAGGAAGTLKKPRRTDTMVSGVTSMPKSPPRVLVEPLSLFSEPVEAVVVPPPTVNEGQASAPQQSPIGIDELLVGFMVNQQRSVSLKASGMRNWRAGARKPRLGGLI